MDSVKRGRGRPKGSGEDDSGALMAIARLMANDPKLKPTTAMKRVRNTRRDWKAGSDDALIRRWQVKWNAEGAVYQERVRVEAERQRRARAAVQTRQASSGSALSSIAAHAPAWGLVAGGPAATSVIDSVLAQSAALEAMVRPSKEWLAAINAMPRMGLSRADLVANPALAGVNVSDTVRRHLEVVNVSGIGDAWRRTDTIGRAMEAINALHLPKLPEGI